MTIGLCSMMLLILWLEERHAESDTIHTSQAVARMFCQELAKRRLLDDPHGLVDVEQPLYVDACHFNRLGNDILADFTANAFLEVLPECAIEAPQTIVRT